MKTYYAYEIVTDGAYDLYVNLDESETTKHFGEEMQALASEKETVETYRIGTVEAESVETALDKIRAGEWVSCTERY